MTKKDIFKTKKEELISKIRSAPRVPGCYLYKDSSGEIIYIGKAKNLLNRVNSYFTNYDRLDIAKSNMIDLVEDIELIPVDSEVEALILESNLIRKYTPKYNIEKKDDKNYIYVRFEKVRRRNQKIPTKDSSFQDFPRITIVREKKEDGADYFGPYPDSTPAKRILKKLRKVFPYRSSKHLVYVSDFDKGTVYTANSKPCFYYHIGLCLGACAGLESKEEYVERFLNVKSFFEGKKLVLLNRLQKEMDEESKKMNYERAAKLRDRINDIRYITANIQIDNSVDDVVIEKLQKENKAKALADLIENLDFVNDKLKYKKEFRMECYDISNIQGTNAVGSMVVMIDGQIKPDLYRRFKIRMKNEPNDFAMLQEVLTRRFRNYLLNNPDKLEFLPEELQTRAKNWKIDESFAQKPDLIIIDGGKGQLASTFKILYQFGLHNEIPIVGLAKKQEEIFKITHQFADEYFNQVNDSSMFSRILLPRRSEALFLVQRIRDEAHRFAVTYHRKLRSKKAIEK